MKKMLLPLFVLAVLISGCASAGGGNVFLKKDFPAPIGKYTAAAVTVDTGAYPASVAEAEAFRTYFVSMLGKYAVFNDIISEDEAKTGKNAVLLKCTVAEYTKISDVQRFAIGSMGGGSSIKIDIDVQDTKTKEILGTIETSGVTGGAIKHAVEKAADLAAQKLSGLK